MINPDLHLAEQLLYNPNGYSMANLSHEAEGQAYCACSFELNGVRCQFRTGKITPKKAGQFATLWKRIGKGPIVPFDLDDPIDYFIISVKEDLHIGQFIFPKAALHAKGIISDQGLGGKCAMRIYPPWTRADNRQARNTQEWQKKHFFEISTHVSSVSCKKTAFLLNGP